jgi:hypothetical protein
MTVKPEGNSMPALGLPIRLLFPPQKIAPVCGQISLDLFDIISYTP